MSTESIGSKHFPALGHRDFRLFWIGQCISLIGTWMQNVGQSWLVYQMTNSSLLLGLISTLQFAPVLLFSLPVGALADRYPKKKILFAVQFFMMMSAFTLSLLVWTKTVAYWNIALLACFLGILNSIDMPIRQSYMVDLASKDHLMNAVALNSTIFNAARIIGPSIAGLVFGYFGAAACFFVNGLSFIPVLICINLIEAQGNNCLNKRKINIIKDIGEGIKYIMQSPNIYIVVLMVAFSSIFIMNFNIIIPVLTRTVFHGDSKAYGYLMTALGIGAFTGAFSLAATSYKGLRPKLQLGAFLGLASFVLIVGFQKSYIMAFIVLIAVGWCMTTALSSANTTLQINSPDYLRGRIMSVYALVLGGAAPLGSMYSGVMCQSLGVSSTMKISGLLGIAFMLYIIIFKYKQMVNKVNIEPQS